MSGKLIFPCIFLKFPSKVVNFSPKINFFGTFHKKAHFFFTKKSRFFEKKVIFSKEHSDFLVGSSHEKKVILNSDFFVGSGKRHFQNVKKKVIFFRVLSKT